MKGMSNPILANTLIIDLSWLAGCLIVGLGLAAWMGVFNLDRIWGPRRLVERASLQRAIVALLAGVLVWGASSQIIVSFWYSGHEQAVDLAHPGPALIALLTMVPPLLGFITLLAVGVAGDGKLAGELGYAPRLIELGFLKGFAAFLAIMPLMFAFLLVLQLFYQWIDYQHPAEHKLLEALNTATKSQRVILAFAAVIVAPFFEEFLFRGHLQSVLHRWFAGPDDVRQPDEFEVPISPMANPGSPMTSNPAGTSLSYEAPPVIVKPRTRRWAPWAAIGISSLLFASVHAAWTSPAIFVLAVGLGYVYERTGNLWACVTIHALFNGTQTFIYLSSAAS
jgi:membrane protease YdiL (CAAX protease family)